MAVAVVVEDGSGVANANSYFVIATADQYFMDRGVTAWAAKTNDEKGTLAIRATETLSETYDGRWAGARTWATQALAWPRVDVTPIDALAVFPIDQVPTAIARATMELAALILAKGDLYAAADSASGALIQKTVGPITLQYAVSKVPNATAFVPSTNRIDLIVAPYLAARRFGLNAVRA